MSRLPAIRTAKKRKSAAKRTFAASLITGYGLAFVCAALFVTLFIQRYSAIPAETLRYAVQQGTRVVIDLSNGRVFERQRDGSTAPPEYIERHLNPPSEKKEKETPDQPADDPQDNKKDNTDKPEAPLHPQEIPEKDATVRIKTASEVDFRDENGAPTLALIIKGAGMSAVSTEDAIAMPKEVTIGFSPYAPSLAMHVNMAAEKGHEILLHLPMEAGDLNLHDPGPYSLMTGLSADENLRRLSIVFALTVRYAGVYSGADENFSIASGAFAPVMRELSRRKVPMIYGGGLSRLSFFQNAEQAGYPAMGADTHIDSVFERDAINAKFDAVLARAKDRGYAILMASPYPVTLTALTELLPRAEKQGVILKPASYFFNKLYGKPSRPLADEPAEKKPEKPKKS